MKDQFYKYIESLQDRITTTIEELDGTAIFEEDIWKRDEGGGGKTRVIENGTIFEKGGVNISAVYGELPEALRKQFKVDEGNFFACGLSIVLHPKIPFVHTVHANCRWNYPDEGDAEPPRIRGIANATHTPNSALLRCAESGPSSL